MPSDYIIVESSGTPLLEQVMVFVIKTIGKSTSEITAILSSLPSAAMGGSVAIAEDASAAWMKGLNGTWGKIGSESGGLPAGGTVGQYIKKLSAAYGDAAWENPDSVPTNNSTNLITSGGVDAALSVLGKAMCVLVEGNKSETMAAVGEYVIVRNSSISGRPDGLYTAAKAIPANTVIDSTYLTAVSGGGLNALKAMVADLNAVVVSWDSNYTPTRSDVAIVYKKGQTCQFIAWNLSFANNMTADTIVGTIPAGYRPLEKTSFFGYNRRQELCRGWIGPDGGLRISLYPGELMYFSATYIAA